MLAVIVAVALVKLIQDRFYGDKGKKLGLYVGAVGAGVAVQFLLAALLKGVPQLAKLSFEAAALRMVIFSATLIILMLLRPQGILAHHEFSWAWVSKLFGRRPSEANA
jgi:hypothetical protein